MQDARNVIVNLLYISCRPLFSLYCSCLTEMRHIFGLTNKTLLDFSEIVVWVAFTAFLR